MQGIRDAIIGKVRSVADSLTCRRDNASRRSRGDRATLYVWRGHDCVTLHDARFIGERERLSSHIVLTVRRATDVHLRRFLHLFSPVASPAGAGGRSWKLVDRAP
jgi:hypothetical protein